MATITTLSKLVPAAACAFGNAGTASVTIPMIIMATSKCVLKARIVLQSQTRTRGVASADLVILFLFSFSTFLHDLGRDLYGPSRTVCSLCRRRTRLFVVSEFFGKNYYTMHFRYRHYRTFQEGSKFMCPVTTVFLRGLLGGDSLSRGSREQCRHRNSCIRCKIVEIVF
jgi:hypothetical protein